MSAARVCICGARIARDNREPLCSPCLALAADHSIVAAREGRRLRSWALSQRDLSEYVARGYHHRHRGLP